MVDPATSSACCLTTLAPAASKRVPRLDMDSIPMFKDFKLPRRSPSTEDEASSSSNSNSGSKSEGEVRHERRQEDISSQPAPTHSGPTTDWRHMLRLAHEDQQRRQGGDTVSMLTDRFR